MSILSYWPVLGYFAALLALFPAGTLVARAVIRLSGAPRTGEPAPEVRSEMNAGRLIGHLERGLIMVGLVLDRWEVILAVIALKTVARHKELDHRDFAEYFLIGSLASIVWAAVVAIAIVWFDGAYGYDLLPKDLITTKI
ncbi:hypothetical protein [Roseibium sp. RKSG952]|uniref:hypothetical protein n=1 Tax=Roseibium sp. RKSG952 TaxID=2529384 RepID=UPI0012BD5567|nr:hypothetical protein [Roseibium sp. RKSG952]MTI00283.1 hypothetical protein [Roseibium sp. RKSG952]